MSALWEGVLTVTLALAAREGPPPGVWARRAAQVAGQGGEGGDRRRSGVLAKGEIAAPLRGRAPRGAEALRPARDEDEIGRRGRIRDQAPPVIVDQQAAIEAFAQLNAAAGVRAAVGAAGDLDQAGAEADGVVAGDEARVAAAEAVGEIAGRAAPGGRGLGGGCAKRRL